MKIRLFLTGSLLSVLLFTSCSNDDPSSGSAFSNGPAELPALATSGNHKFVSHSTTVGGQEVNTFSLEYDLDKKHARWVAFKFYNTTGQTTVGRSDEPFGPDPLVGASSQRVQTDFGRKGYDRGHLCASADRLYSETANEQTFYYTNMSPQKNSFNTGIWRELEAAVQNWGRSNVFRDTLYVVKGASIDRKEHIWTYIDGDQTKPVPKYYFMALLNKKGDRFKAIAFWLDQSKTYGSKEKLSNYAITVDELEELTGIDFFHNLNDELESGVEAQFSANAWNGI